ncbi:DnaB-like replicative helicase [Pseudomonas phage PhiPA3]|uniref:Putative helicase n=1 Tax=Pseudomonas phage PhiPA3 TaxID=998086 RepID=F8SK07_BPPA3|nr:DnaB-like replicative helicase [Pseudomonas phage PhiPA3]AEH03557.1 putative helicase [Pseudomonas phage PhiPA3]
MSSPKQLLVQCVTLLCLEHREDSPAAPSTELISEIINTLEVRDTTVDHDHGRQTFLELRKLVGDLNSKAKHDFPSLAEVLQAVQVSCREENYLYEAVVNGVKEDFPDGMSIMRAINSRRSALNAHLNDEKIKQIVREYSQKLLFNRGGSGDIAGAINEMGAKLDPYVKARAESRHPAEMGCLDFSEPEAVEDFFEQVQTTLSADGAFKTGWKGFNRILGSLGAFRRGEFITTAALQHNFKSYMLMLLFSHIALFNRPFMRDKTKKPLLLFVTLENEISDNLLTIYKYIRENETGEEIIVADIDKREAAAYVCARLQENGFNVKMIRFDPTEFTIGGFTNYLDGLQSQGYEIQMLMVDYLNMLPKTGLDAKVAGDDIRLLFRRMRNYTTP